MTTKIVADDLLGKVAIKQWELYRRVKEGSLDVHSVLRALQGIIENEVEQFGIEKLDWTVSSKIHEILVEEGVDFQESVQQASYVWNHGRREGFPFELKGTVKKRKHKNRFRLAELHQEVELGVVKTYAQLAGFDLATAWELLSFVRQSTVTRILKDKACFVALGNCGTLAYTKGKPTESFIVFPKEDHVGYVTVSSFLERRTWSFHWWGSESYQAKLDRRQVHPRELILLKEQD